MSSEVTRLKKVRKFATRTLKDVPLTFENEQSERVTEKFTIVYRSYSTRAIQEFQASVPESERQDGVIPFSVMLGKYVVSIIDSDGEPLTDDSGEAADLSNGFFGTIDVGEAKDLWELIQADIFPPKASQPSGSSGLPAAVSEA
jgi:hypothetical protein